MSRPVTDSAAELVALHHAAGIWKSPMNVPDEESVSTRVNPVSPRPLLTPEAKVQVPASFAPGSKALRILVS